MDRLKGLFKQLRAALRTERADRDMRDELAFHLEQEAEQNRRMGMTVEEARRAARLSFGPVERIAEELRGAGLRGVMAGLVRDHRDAGRALRRRPALSAAVIVTLGLGIGVSTAMYTVAHAVVIRPLPYPDPGRLIAVWETYPAWRGRPILGDQWNRIGLAWPDYERWRAGQKSFDDVAVFASARMTAAVGGRSEVLTAGRASGSLWRVLGVQAAHGRLYGEPEAGPGAAPIAVLSHALWSRLFAADHEAIGRTVRLDGHPFTIIGVLEPDFGFGAERSAPFDVWIPIGAGGFPIGEDNHAFAGIGRLRDGVAQTAAAAEAEGLFLGERRPGSIGAALVSYRQQVVGEARRPILGLLAGAALLLLIGCGNAAALLAADAGRRGREVATRRALGATRGRIVRQFVAEALVLSVAGGLAGLGLAWFALPAIVALAPPDLPRLAEVGIDGGVLAFAFLAAGATTILCAAGSVAALELRPAEMGHAGVRVTGGRRIIQPLFVGVQLAILAILVTIGALLARSLLAVRAVDPGFTTANILTTPVEVSADRFPGREALVDFYRRLTAEIRRLPGVDAVSGVSTAPFVDGSESTSVGYEGLAENARKPEMQRRVVLPGYIDLMAIPVVSGTGSLRDRMPEVVVSESMAARLWPDQPAVGRRISLRDRWYTVAGVVADVRDQALATPPQGTYYVLQETDRELSARMRLVIRMHPGLESAGLVQGVRRAMQRTDPSVPMGPVDALDSLLGRSLSTERYRTVLVNMFAGAALLLAVVGMFGVTLRVMRRRRRELGVRLALGARPSTLIASGLGRTTVGAAAGIAAGLVATSWLTPSLAPYFYELPPRDVGTFAGSAALLLLVSLAATAVPTIRAARMNVVEVLREE